MLEMIYVISFALSTFLCEPLQFRHRLPLAGAHLRSEEGVAGDDSGVVQRQERSHGVGRVDRHGRAVAVTDRRQRVAVESLVRLGALAGCEEPDAILHERSAESSKRRSPGCQTK